MHIPGPNMISFVLGYWRHHCLGWAMQDRVHVLFLCPKGRGRCRGGRVGRYCRVYHRALQGTGPTAGTPTSEMLRLGTGGTVGNRSEPPLSLGRDRTG
eukprot:750373-Hanusia_phi.AAC.1